MAKKRKEFPRTIYAWEGTLGEQWAEVSNSVKDAKQLLSARRA